MLLANITVAKQLSVEFPCLAFLRCHPSPHPYATKEMQKAMEERGIFIDISSAGGLQASMCQYGGDDPNGQARMLVLNNLCARSMSVSYRDFANVENQ
jgi:exoribonuclease R